MRTHLTRLSLLLTHRTFTTAAMSSTATPLEDAIRSKLTSLTPRTLEIWNDSHKHAHHSAMQGVTDKKETHFRWVIVGLGVGKGKKMGVWGWEGVGGGRG